MLTKEVKSEPLRTMLHLDHAYQKLITHLHLEIVMPIYNLLEYNNNFSMTPGSLLNYYRDELNNDTNEKNDAGIYRIN